MKKIILFLSILLIFSNPSVFAAHTTALYQGTLPVASQSPELRSQVAADALAQVLVKVSGNTQVLANPEIKANLKTANSLIEEFSYTATPKQPKPYLLHLDFDADGINKILRDAGAPIWGQNRPLLLVWLDYEIPNHPAEIIGANSNSTIAMLLQENAARRGLPLIFPAMDITDMGQAGVNDVVTMNVPKLTNATKRYASDAILVGRILQTVDGYSSQWKLVMGNDQWGWNVTSKSLPDMLAAITDRIADTLSGRYATVITNAVQATLTVKITNMTQPDDFSDVINYIKHLTPVANVLLVEVQGSDLILRINLRGTRESFTQALSVGQKLTAVPLPAASDNKQRMLIYQWNH